MGHIAKIGFEIEGGWKGGDYGIGPFDDITLIADRSVNGQRLKKGEKAIKAPHVGEAVSPPMLPSDPWEEWLTSHWPNADAPNRTNSTCGLHIHISLNSIGDYTLLSSKDFLYSLREAVLAKGRELEINPESEFWPRVEGKNYFCKLAFDSARQMKVKKDGGIHNSRYGWLNFSWSAHGTLEFRALPTFHEAELGIAFTHVYLDQVENWLDAHAGLSIEKTASLRG